MAPFAWIAGSDASTPAARSWATPANVATRIRHAADPKVRLRPALDHKIVQGDAPPA
jgi:hypothetical protein